MAKVITNMPLRWIKFGKGYRGRVKGELQGTGTAIVHPVATWISPPTKRSQSPLAIFPVRDYTNAERMLPHFALPFKIARGITIHHDKVNFNGYITGEFGIISRWFVQKTSPPVLAPFGTSQKWANRKPFFYLLCLRRGNLLSKKALDLSVLE